MNEQSSLCNAANVKSFIESYVDYASDLTDAPEIYHQVLGLNLLSLAVGRSPISITPNQLYPNMWVVLIGLSGVSRKSSAMKLANSILPEQKKPLPNDFSPESLQQALSEQPQGLIWKEEIGGFLENIKKKDYMSGTADLLCQLFDCPASYNRRLRSINFSLKNVCFNIVGATTPSRFMATVKLSDYESGFAARLLPVVGVKTKSLRRRKFYLVDNKKRDALRVVWQSVFDVFHDPKRRVTFEFEDSALDYLNNWCDLKDAEVLKTVDVREADLKGAVGARMQDYAIKLSALFEVDELARSLKGKSGSMLVVSRLSSNSAVIQIRLESAQRACSIIDFLLTQLTTNILTLLTASPLLVRLTNTIKNKADPDGWTQHRVVLPLMNMTAPQFRVLLDSAIQRNLIEVKTEGKANYYRAKTSDKPALSIERKQLSKIEASLPSPQYSEPHQRRAHIPNLMPTEV
jgi:hypothetical protein